MSRIQDCYSVFDALHGVKSEQVLGSRNAKQHGGTHNDQHRGSPMKLDRFRQDEQPRRLVARTCSITKNLEPRFRLPMTNGGQYAATGGTEAPSPSTGRSNVAGRARTRR